MNLFSHLIDTYDRCAGKYQGDDALVPGGHTLKNTQINVVLSVDGSIITASVSKHQTVIPCTEDSFGRTSGIRARPLCENLQYCGKDFPSFTSFAKDRKKSPECFKDYHQLLSKWVAFDPYQPKLKAILTYIEKGTLTADLIRNGILFVDSDNKLLKRWTGEGAAPPIFKLLQADGGEYNQGKAMIRWSVISDSNDLSTNVWTDPNLQQSWIRYVAQTNESVKKGLCMVTGKIDVIRRIHPGRLRNPADGAKLISSNDGKAFTFRGRFSEANQVASIGSDATEKAHAALRWLIGRQGYTNGGEVIVAWNTSDTPVVSMFWDTAEILSNAPKEIGLDLTDQEFGLALKKAIMGIGNPSTADTTVVAAFDSLSKLSKGRIALTYYQEYNGSEYKDHIFDWHRKYAWHQNYPGKRFAGTPSLRDIAEAAYGKRGIPSNTFKRLLPCILEGRPVPKDIVSACVRRICKPNLEWYEFRKYLGITCSLVKGNSKGNYEMTLDKINTNRGYLFGRLLAIGERLEQDAQYSRDKEKKNYKTHAERQMSRFVMRPAAAWQTIRTALVPYRDILRSNRPGSLVNYDKLIAEVTSLFQPGDFSNQKLNEEFILGYDLQKKALWEKNDKEKENEDE